MLLSPEYPALEHPVLFEADVIVMRAGKMFLDGEARIAHRLILVPEIQRRP